MVTASQTAPTEHIRPVILNVSKADGTYSIQFHFGS